VIKRRGSREDAKAQRKSSGQKQAGVTLIELVLTIVIVSVAVAGVVGAFSLVMGRSADTLVQSRATALGQAYLDEILARNFDVDTGSGGTPAYTGGCRIQGEPNGDRASFVAVDQYDGITDQPPELVSGAFGADYSGYQVTVTVSCAGGEVGVAADNAKRIDVAVAVPQGPDRVFTAYKGNY